MLLIEHPGAIYHVMNRGDLWKELFPQDRHRELFFVTPFNVAAQEA